MTTPILIAHAGGSIRGHGYTNSIEACLRALAAGFRFVELDVVTLADGYGIAHDETEQRFYGLDRAFDEVSLHEFARLRVVEQFIPMTFELLDLLSAARRDASFILDSKFASARDLGALVDWIGGRYPGLLGRCIFQVYSTADARECLERGARRVLFALWKNFHSDYLGAAAQSEAVAIAGLPLDVFGISLRCHRDRARDHSNITDPRLDQLRALGLPILLHDLGELDPNALLAGGFGLFAHSASGIATRYLQASPGGAGTPNATGTIPRKSA